MGLTLTRVTQEPRSSDGYYYRTVYTVAWDSSYPTGGESLTPGDCGLVSSISDGEYWIEAWPSKGYVPEYDKANKKMKLYWANYPGAAAGALVEVTNATDVSAITGMLLVAYGRRA